MKSKLEFKVGLFVLAGLVLLAIMMLQFSKGMSFFRPTYRINLQAEDAGGLREKAAVLMSGVQVGSVSDIQLAPDGRSVQLGLKIYKDYPIYQDAKFVLEQSGFLGDQYVAIVPTENRAPVFQDGGHASTEAPFNLQQAARSAAGLVARLDETAKRLSDAIADIHETLLNEHTLTNMAVTVANLRQVSERARAAVERIDLLVQTNTPVFSQSGSNLVEFSEQLKAAGGHLNSLLATNSPDVTAAVQNLEESSLMIRQLLQDVREGKGAAGTLLQDEQVAAHISTLARNLAITSENLNRRGLWGILWKRKEPKNEESVVEERLQSPKASTR